MRVLLGVSRTIDTMIEWLGKLNVVIVTLMVAIGFLNVVARFLGRYVGLRLTSNAIIEAQWYLFSLLFFFGFAYILKHNLNVRVDFFTTNWSPRRKALIDLIGHLCFFVPFCILGIYVSISPVMKSWGQLPDGTFGEWEISPDPDGLPRAPIKSMIIVAFALLLLQSLSEIIKLIAVLRNVVPAEAVIIEHNDAIEAEELVKEFQETHKKV